MAFDPVRCWPGTDTRSELCTHSGSSQEPVGCNLTESDNLSHSVSLNMNGLRIVKRFELLQINVSIFLSEQSKVDEDKAFVLEEHLGRINRYSEARSSCSRGWSVGPADGFRRAEHAPNSAVESTQPLFH